MKTKLLILVLLTTSYLQAQVVNIPDPNFLHRLVNHTAYCGCGTVIDTNHNGQIEVSEAEAITEMRVGDPFLNNYKIVDMTGIEAFVNLTKLECYNNEIEVLDLNQNTLLEYVDCSDNYINSLNVTGCTALVELNCSENELTNIDVSQNLVLTHLSCYENSINSLDVTQNPILISLGCTDNNLNSIDITQNSLLDCFFCNNNQLTDLDLTQNQLLTGLYCQNNLLTTIDVTNNTQLQRLSFRNNFLLEINISQCIQLEKLWGGENQLDSIDLTNNTYLKKIILPNNQLTFFDIRNGVNENITDFDTTNNPYLTCIFVDDENYSTENWLNIDGNSHFVNNQEECDAIGLVEQHISSNLAIVPNPMDNSFIIDTELNYNSIAIYNNIGSLIAKYNKQDTYFLKELTSGVYIIQIKTLKGVFIKKLIKQ